MTPVRGARDPPATRRRHAVTERGGASLFDTAGIGVNPRKPLTTHAQKQELPRYLSGVSVSPEVAR